MTKFDIEYHKGHPLWCRVVEAHNREDCRRADQMPLGWDCKHVGDVFWCVTHSSAWSRDEACDQVYIDAERAEVDRVLQQAKDEWIEDIQERRGSR